jgi:hypothetical protein
MTDPAATGTERLRFQLVGAPGVRRTEHVWFRRNNRWKCCLCGAVTRKTPPPVPEPDGWRPDAVEPLTDQERSLCPMEVPDGD